MYDDYTIICYAYLMIGNVMLISGSCMQCLYNDRICNDYMMVVHIRSLYKHYIHDHCKSMTYKIII